MHTQHTTEQIINKWQYFISFPYWLGCHFLRNQKLNKFCSDKSVRNTSSLYYIASSCLFVLKFGSKLAQSLGWSKVVRIVTYSDDSGLVVDRRVEMNQNVAKALQGVEKMVIEQDYDGAREKLVEMKNVYPSALDLNQIGSMLSVCEVLSAAKLSLPLPASCGVDHYWVLKASPFFNLSDITTHYRQIIGSLQPLKTKFPAADLALQLVETAFSVISDRQKRSLYDSARNASRQGPQGYKVVSLDLQALPRRPDFDLDLVKGRPCLNYYNFEADRGFSRIEQGQIWAAHFGATLQRSFRYARVSFSSDGLVCVTWLRPIPISASERRWCESGLPVSCGSFDLSLETTCELSRSWPTIASHKCAWSRGVVEGQFEIYPRRGEIWAVYRDWNIDEWAYCGLDSLKQCKLELVEITSEFSKYTGVDCAYLVKVDGFRCIYERKRVQGCCVTLHIRPGMFYMFSHNVPAYRFVGGEISKVVEGMFELDRFALPDCSMTDDGPRTENTPEAEMIEKLSSCEPHREGYFLKPHWSVNDFSSGQIWAVCCGNDFMPRQYARVDHVVSDCQVCVTFLEPLITLDTQIEWKKENLPIMCGVFQVSTTNLYIGVSQFSYLVKCRQRIGTFFEIHPRKGEIWAMYKKWNNKWKRYDHEACDCQIVQILSDFSEGEGIRIVRLEEVKGCLTIFQKQQCDGFYMTSLVSNQEALSFSHRIPAFRVPGIGRHGIPESSWHLEPNALPPKRRV